MTAKTNLREHSVIRRRIGTHEMRITKLQNTLGFLVLEHKGILCELQDLKNKYRNHLEGFHNIRK